MLYIIELQKDLIRVNHRSAAIFPAVIREDVFDVKVMGFIERHHPVIKNIHGSFWKLGGIELTKGKGSRKYPPQPEDKYGLCPLTFLP